MSQAPRPGPRKLTINDIASEAGVSKKTVSRVINGEKYVNEETRAKVIEVMAALHFSPNPQARSLAARRSFLLGMVYPRVAASFSDFMPYVVGVQEGVLSYCRAKGYELVVHPCDYEHADVASEIDAFLKRAEPAGVVLLPPASEFTDVLDLLDRNGRKFVRISQQLDGHPSPGVGCDVRKATEAMTVHLIGLGHRRIAFVGGQTSFSQSEARRSGYRDALARYGIPVDDTLIVKGLWSFDSGKEQGHHLLAMNEPPTAIFASSDEMAAGVLMAAHERGIDVPGALSVAGFNDMPIATRVWPPLTTIRQPVYDFGRVAAEALIELIEDPVGTQPGVNRAVPFELISRASVGPVPRVGVTSA
ncbi:LacI family DNA-binding transcriptional regulator [Iodidimonas sp. SYSU 1G8]|uniref:LacI family DNA-binding transcriptional regulator n=1 Tax=Iodidimonas sp. SYSU 1G8 TaxID=3133967 RepID=UPI0031FEE06C